MWEAIYHWILWRGFTLLSVCLGHVISRARTPLTFLLSHTFLEVNSRDMGSCDVRIMCLRPDVCVAYGSYPLRWVMNFASSTLHRSCAVLKCRLYNRRIQKTEERQSSKDYTYSKCVLCYRVPFYSVYEYGSWHSFFFFWHMKPAYTWNAVPVYALQVNLTFRRLTSTIVDYRTANIQNCILYIYSTNIGTEYFKHGVYSPFLSL